MANLDDKSIKNLSELCRIDCTAEERQELLKDLVQILDYVDQLKEVDTKGIRPCCHVLADMPSALREDEVGEILSRKTFLDNAPEHTGGMIKVPSVISKKSRTESIIEE